MKNKFRYLLEYIPFYVIVRLLQLLPLEVSLRGGRCLGLLLYRLSGKRVKMAEENISRSLGTGKKESEQIAKRAFVNVGATLAEFVNTPSLGETFFSEKISVEGMENFEKAKEEGKGVLLLGAHIGNWEMLGAFHNKCCGPASVVYRKTKNPHVDNFINSIRRAYGADTIPHRNSVRKIISALKKGASVGILLDQHAIPDDAVIVDFFGRPAATNYGLALIALKTGAPVVPVFMVRDGSGRHRCIYEKPIVLEKTNDRDGDIKKATIRFNGAIEKIIRAYPDQWFWIHNRWKV